MCLGIPMKVIKIDGQFARVNAGGLMRQVNIQMLPRVKRGDYVIVHAGFAIQILDPKEAEETLQLFRELIEAHHA